MSGPDRLTCPVMPYAWGSRTALAELRGAPSPTDGPEAELWLGAHPRGPARLVRDGRETDLFAAIAAAPEAELGAACVARFGPRLPFLTKVLAAAAPLSIQAHPSEVQAREGFAAEEARGVPVDAPHRNYRDPFHKPELLCALGPFEALSGFRPTSASAALFAGLGLPRLAPLVDDLSRGDLRAAFARVMRTEDADRASLVADVRAACARAEGPFEAERAWAVRLADAYPGDVGVLGALLLNHLTLEADEAIYLGAQSLHAYLVGVGVEIMASSDNVLRGGLTPKHVDVDELLSVVRFEAEPPRVLAPEIVASASGFTERRWKTPAREFELSRIDVDGEATRDTRGPEILLCTEGEITISETGAPVVLSRGESAFVRGTTPHVRLSGRGRLFRSQIAA